MGRRVRQRLMGSWRCLQNFAFILLNREDEGVKKTQINDSMNLGRI